MTERKYFDNQKDLIAEREASQLAVFCYKQTKFFLDAIGYSQKRRQIVSTVYARTGRYALPYDAVIEQCPELPVYLVFQRLGSLHTMPAASFPSLFNRFDSSPMYKAYRQAIENSRETTCQTIGLVFPRNRIIHGMVLHNGDPGLYCLNGSTMIIQDDKLGTLLLQRFKDFAAAVAANKHNWRSEE